jgi:glycosyltransferase involved in cell wall biosynthesis
MPQPDHRPRVAFLGYAHDARGGIAQFGRRLAETVSERADVRLVGYRQLYPSFTRPGRQAADPSHRLDGLTGERITVPWRPSSWRATSRHIAAFDPQLLVIQWWTPLLGPSVRSIVRRARRGGLRTLIMIHNDRPHEPFPLWRQITRNTLAQADVLAAFTEPVAGAVRAMVPSADVHVSALPQSLVAMSENGTCDWDARLGAPAGKVILFFGNVRAYKGLEDLVAALPRLRERVDATLVVAGTFMEPLERYQEQVRSLGVEDRVRFLPDYIPDEEVGGLFARSDVVALPYRHAPGSGVLGQAAQAGRPVVATAVGSLPALVGERGVLVPPGDPEALADGLVRALREPPPPPRVDDGAWEHWRDFVLASAGAAA